ncbi:uncharacterized protein LOC103513693 [Diaphorina citri]|uniref:Uncharacterized protein LOC103513693 n=1 Tax=Diaphorina citri TaxID=121845 RepID=A0A3Q0J2A5_DIACI|nr:uncharacterized protein LOC103513693 [Diaphorina citri]
MMPSFRQKFVGFIRQLSNTSDSARDSDVPDNASECFIQNYLKGIQESKGDKEVHRSGVEDKSALGSHDVHQMRDMRDALGALGPVDGQNPELSNLTLSMTEVERGDIVFLTSDGVSDNLDPVVGKFTVFRYGVSGKGPSISSARELVTLLLDFVTRLTAAKRHILEDKDLYAGRDGRTLSSSEQITRRREVCKKLHAIPGKLDHATVAAYMVGKFGDTSRSEEHKGRDNRDIRGDVDTSRVDVDTVRDKIETLKVQDTSRGDEVRDNSSIGDVEQDAVETLKVRQVHDGDDVKRRDNDNISSDVKKERKENDNRRVKTKESKGDKEVHRSGVEDKVEKRTNEENI